MKTKSIVAVAVLMTLSTISFASCESSTITSELRSFNNNFFGIILKSNAQVILSQGTETSVRIEGDAKNVSSVETSVEQGALVIRGTNQSPVTVYVTVNDISLLEVDGQGKIYSGQSIYSDMLLLKVAGSGSINVDVRTLSLGMIVKGSGKIYVKGSTGDSFTRVSGNGQVVAINLDSFKTSSEVVSENTFVKKSNANAPRRSVLRLRQ